MLASDAWYYGPVSASAMAISCSQDFVRGSVRQILSHSEMWIRTINVACPVRLASLGQRVLSRAACNHCLCPVRCGTARVHFVFRE
eukprot:6212227-Pleurochrysis_carterae.AAC.3